MSPISPGVTLAETRDSSRQDRDQKKADAIAHGVDFWQVEVAFGTYSGIFKAQPSQRALPDYKESNSLTIIFTVPIFCQNGWIRYMFQLPVGFTLDRVPIVPAGRLPWGRDTRVRPSYPRWRVRPGKRPAGHRKAEPFRSLPVGRQLHGEGIVIHLTNSCRRPRHGNVVDPLATAIGVGHIAEGDVHRLAGIGGEVEGHGLEGAGHRLLCP